MDWDEIFSLSLFWAYDEMIKFLGPNSPERGSPKRHNVWSTIWPMVTAALQQHHKILGKRLQVINLFKMSKIVVAFEMLEWI